VVLYSELLTGSNWIAAGGFGNTLYSVYFPDINTGFACGSPGIVIKSTNGGVNWVQQTISTTTNLRSIYFNNLLTGWTAGTDSRLYKTTNGGTTWSMFYNQSLCGLYSVRFANDQTGWVCGCEGAINGTTNGGINWFLQSFFNDVLYSMSFISTTTGWAVGFEDGFLKQQQEDLQLSTISNEFLPNINYIKVSIRSINYKSVQAPLFRGRDAELFPESMTSWNGCFTFSPFGRIKGYI
jgi:hypothetical protein